MLLFVQDVAPVCFGNSIVNQADAVLTVTIKLFVIDVFERKAQIVGGYLACASF
jgi:hypothetical protein